MVDTLSMVRMSYARVRSTHTLDRCGRKQRMEQAFHTGNWTRHKNSNIHKKARMPIEVSDSEDDAIVQEVLAVSTNGKPKRKYKAKASTQRRKNLKRPNNYADFAASMIQAMEEDADYLVFYRNQLDQRVKEDRCTKDLIRGMSLLIVEQQEDIDALNNQVESLNSTVQVLQDEMQTIRKDTSVSKTLSSYTQGEVTVLSDQIASLNSLSRTVQALQDEMQRMRTDISQSIRREICSSSSLPQDAKVPSDHISSTKEAETNIFIIDDDDDDDQDDEMNMFDNQIHLMQLD